MLTVSRQSLHVNVCAAESCACGPLYHKETDKQKKAGECCEGLRTISLCENTARHDSETSRILISQFVCGSG